jgi:hypothetical protein
MFSQRADDLLNSAHSSMQRNSVAARACHLDGEHGLGPAECPMDSAIDDPALLPVESKEWFKYSIAFAPARLTLKI